MAEWGGERKRVSELEAALQRFAQARSSILERDHPPRPVSDLVQTLRQFPSTVAAGKTVAKLPHGLYDA